MASKKTSVESAVTKAAKISAKLLRRIEPSLGPNGLTYGSLTRQSAYRQTAGAVSSLIGQFAIPEMVEFRRQLRDDDCGLLAPLADEFICKAPAEAAVDLRAQAVFMRETMLKEPDNADALPDLLGDCCALALMRAVAAAASKGEAKQRRPARPIFAEWCAKEFPEPDPRMVAAEIAEAFRTEAECRQEADNFVQTRSEFRGISDRLYERAKVEFARLLDQRAEEADTLLRWFNEYRKNGAEAVPVCVARILEATAASDQGLWAQSTVIARALAARKGEDRAMGRALLRSLEAVFGKREWHRAESAV